VAFRSGQHEELHRANGEAAEDSEQGAEDKDKKKKLSRVHRYAFVLPNDNNVTMPMFTFAYEELYDQTLTNVTCIRVWKFVSTNDSTPCHHANSSHRLA